MAKIGRNDLCACGSGKKYKRCCLTNDETAARATLTAANAAAADVTPHQHAHFCHDCSDRLDDAANAAFALIEAKKFGEAEQAAQDVLTRFPSVHDGYECLGRLYQAKGDHSQAADCYRQVIEFDRREPHLYDPEFVDHFQDLIDRLEPQGVAECSTASRHPRLRRGASLTPSALPAVLNAGRRQGMASQSHQGMSKRNRSDHSRLARAHFACPSKSVIRKHRKPITLLAQAHSSNLRNAITFFGSAAGSSGVGIDESSISDSRRAEHYLTSSSHLRMPCPHRHTPVETFQRGPSGISPLVSLTNHWPR
ncbi:MAG TPA: SEC-C metal-binding domain-containing protein [Acetobacteraceae bacterium]|nr:SEC-C metal-binding domain-containing protein [Acetobacteraceae bacterium]